MAEEGELVSPQSEQQGPIGGESHKPNRGKACNHCKQQKLRCSLLAVPLASQPTTDECSRCVRFGLDCKVELGFRRTRKRRRQYELETENRSLRQQLENQTQPSPGAETIPDWAELSDQPLDRINIPLNIDDFNLPGSGSVNQTPTTLAGESATGCDAEEEQYSAQIENPLTSSLTTKPIINEAILGSRSSIPIPRPRSLGSTTLSAEEIDKLFLIFMKFYHPFLPLIDPSKSPHEYDESSELLFWSIISVASRRLHSVPTLLPKLAQSVPDLLWRAIRSIPYSISVVQGLAIICTWPFPTSSSTADPTYTLAGILLQLATQMGLHRAHHVQDFINVPLQLSATENAECAKTWEICNIIAQRVSVGCGLPMMVQPQYLNIPGSLANSSTVPGISLTLDFRISKFMNEVSSVLAFYDPNSTNAPSFPHRISLYRLLESSLRELERDNNNETKIASWYLSAARLHLRSFYLLDRSNTDGYKERILSLYSAASSLIESSQELHETETKFLDYCPLYCYQVFSSAAVVLLKVFMNDYFRQLINETEGMKLINTSIHSLRKLSVVNNDLPARLGEVLAFFCTLPDTAVIGGSTADDLQLRQVRNRLSMSVVYDSLWIWRKHFQTETNHQSQDTYPSH